MIICVHAASECAGQWSSSHSWWNGGCWVSDLPQRSHEQAQLWEPLHWGGLPHGWCRVRNAPILHLLLMWRLADTAFLFSSVLICAPTTYWTLASPALKTVMCCCSWEQTHATKLRCSTPESARGKFTHHIKHVSCVLNHFFWFWDYFLLIHDVTSILPNQLAPQWAACCHGGSQRRPQFHIWPPGRGDIRAEGAG